MAVRAPGPLVSAEASSSGLRKRTHFCLTPSEINLAAIKNKRSAVMPNELRPLMGRGGGRKLRRDAMRGEVQESDEENISCGYMQGNVKGGRRKGKKKSMVMQGQNGQAVARAGSTGGHVFFLDR